MNEFDRKKAEQLFRQSVDYRVEIIMATLQEEGLNLDDITIAPVSIFGRSYDRDVSGIKTQEITLGKIRLKDLSVDTLANKVLYVEINREGIYDAVPEGIFHQPASARPPRTKIEIIEEMKEQKRREEAAREFFLPLEQEFYRQRILIEQEERKYLVDVGQTDTNLARLWQLPGFLSKSQSHNLIYLLPVASFIAGNLHLTKLCFESILGDSCNILITTPLSHTVSEDFFSPLGKMALGTDFVLAGNYQEVLPAFEITIQVFSQRDMFDYLPGNLKNKVLQYLTAHFIPAENDVVLNYDILKSGRSFLLSEESHFGRLGYTSFI